METCGFIIRRGRDLQSFLMRCSYCTFDMEIDQWTEFVLHFRNMHGHNKDNLIELKTTEVPVDEGCIKEELLDVPLAEEEVETDLKDLLDVPYDEEEVETELKVPLEVDHSRASSLFSDSSLSENDSAESESNDQSEKEDKQGIPSNLPTFKVEYFIKEYYIY